MPLVTRKDKRIRASLDVVVEQPNRTTKATTGNVSAGGLLLLDDGDLCDGDEIAMQISWKSESLALKGKVVHADNGKVGVAFSSADKQSRVQLLTLIDSLENIGCPVDERRAFQRGSVPDSLPVSWWDKEAEIVGELKNLSMSGALLAADIQPEVGTTVHMRLPRAGELIGPSTPKERDCVARVVRTEKSAFAIEFVNPSEPFLTTVAALLLADAVPE